MRREVFSDGVVGKPEAEALVALNAMVIDQSAEWNEFFVEALSDYVVHQAKPEGPSLG